jgi:hypothetical protein
MNYLRGDADARAASAGRQPEGQAQQILLKRSPNPKGNQTGNAI